MIYPSAGAHSLQTNGQTTTMPIVRALLKHGRLKN